MSWGAVAGAAIGVVGGSLAAGKAADASEAGAQAAAQAQLEMYNQTRDDLKPWMNTGKSANTQLNAFLDGDYSSFTKSPGYDFRLNEGNKAINHAAAKNGMIFSGNTLKALSKYNQDYASNEFGNYWNRLYNISGMGQNAAAQVGSQGASAATNMGNGMMAGADARASGYLAQGNMFNSAANAIGSAYSSQNDPYSRDNALARKHGIR